MHLEILLAFLAAAPATIAHPARNPYLSLRDDSSALALVSAYTEDNCDGVPFGNFVLDFETADQCVGNGTVAKGINVQKLASGCVANAWSNLDCTGERYPLTQDGCWVQFTYDNVDTGVQGIEVNCGDSSASMTTSSSSPAATVSMTRL